MTRPSWHPNDHLVTGLGPLQNRNSLTLPQPLASTNGVAGDGGGARSLGNPAPASVVSSEGLCPDLTPQNPAPETINAELSPWTWYL